MLSLIAPFCVHSCHLNSLLSRLTSLLSGQGRDAGAGLVKQAQLPDEVVCTATQTGQPIPAKNIPWLFLNSECLWSCSELDGVNSYSGKLLWQRGDLLSSFLTGSTSLLN